MKLTTKKYMAFFMALFIVCFATISFFGIHSRWGFTVNNYFKGWQNLQFGQDFDNHVCQVYSPTKNFLMLNSQSEDFDEDDARPEINPYDDEIVRKIENRLTNLGLTDNKIVVDRSQNQIIVSYSQPKNSMKLDPQEINSIISSKGTVTINSSENESNMFNVENQNNFVDTSINNDYIKSAELMIKETANSPNAKPEYGIKIKLTDEGKQKLTELSNTIVGKNDEIKKLKTDQPSVEKKDLVKLTVKFDGFPIFEQELTKPIVNGVIEIFRENPGFNKVNATQIAAIINNGALPLTLERLTFLNAPPNLGLWFKRCTFFALLVAIAAILLFLILKFKLVGLICSICLIGNLGFTLACYTGFFNLYPGVIFNFPAFVGSLVSILISTCACFLISSKIKLHSKLVKNQFALAVKNGFKQASKLISFWSINLTIIAIVLMALFSFKTNLVAFAIQPIYDLLEWHPTFNNEIASFAYAIFIGGIGSLIFNVMLMKFMLSPITSPNLSFDYKKIIASFQNKFKSKKAKNTKIGGTK